MDYNLLQSSFVGTLLGVLVGGGISAYATYRLGVYMFKKERLLRNNEIRKDEIYQPLYNDVSKIQKNFLTRSSTDLQYDVSCEPTPDFILWRRIRSDNKLFLISNTHVEGQCDGLYQLLFDYNALHEKMTTHFIQRIKLFIHNKYGVTPVQDPSAGLFALSIYDRRFDIDKAFEGVFSRIYFEYTAWPSIEADIERRGRTEVLQECLDFISYADFQKTHAVVFDRILKSVSETKNVLLKEIRRVIKEGEK